MYEKITGSEMSLYCAFFRVIQSRVECKLMYVSKAFLSVYICGASLATEEIDICRFRELLNTHVVTVLE